MATRRKSVDQSLREMQLLEGDPFEKPKASGNGHKPAEKLSMGPEFAHSDDLTMQRLLYLVTRYQIRIPDDLAKMMPAGSWLKKLYQGPGSAGFSDVATMTQFKAIYTVGESMGPGSREEGVQLISKVVGESIDQRKDLNLTERLKLMGRLGSFMNATTMLEEEQIVDLQEVKPGELIPKWQTGFFPFDSVLDGVYQGIFILMGAPGTGKTSLCLSLMEAVARTKAANSVLYVQNEIPAKMMRGRMSPILGRVKFRPGDKLITAFWSAGDVMDWVIANPDPDRLIIYDSPDVVVGGLDEGKRFYLEAAYQTLVQLKQKCKGVITTSQPRRKDINNLSMASLAEAWSKAWYADGVIAISKREKGLRLTCVKNRFGPPDRTIPFDYDYEKMIWTAVPQEEVEPEW